MDSPKTIAFLTLGCKLNYAETSTYERGFKEAGLQVVPWNRKADAYLVNTCSVTATSDAKSRNLIRKVHRVNPDALIAVTGCSAQLRRSSLEPIDGVWRVFGCYEKHLVVPSLLDALGQLHPPLSDLRCAHPTTGFAGGPPAYVVAGDHGSEGVDALDPAASRREQTASDVSFYEKTLLAGCPKDSLLETHVHPRTCQREGPAGYKLSQSDDAVDSGRDGAKQSEAEGNSAENAFGQASKVFGAYSTGERTRSFLKVQDGCNNFCKYCTVPYARGLSRNIPICECVRMAEAIAAEGVKEIVLTGVNTGDFGRTTGESFLDLLKALNEVKGIERYRISSIEPNLITEEIIDWIASGTKFQPHFHIPLQTGADSQLKRMGRRYDTQFFADRIAYIRKAMEAPGKPLVFFGIDVMVGLPGESRELFEQTKAFIEKIHPSFIHVFPYSRRPGTPADLMPDQVSEEEKKERVAELEDLCRRLSKEFREANRGIRETVLFESTDRKGTMEGYTGNYIRVERPYDASLVNQLVEVTL